MRRGRRIGAAFIAASCLFAALPAWPQEPAAEKPAVTSDFDAIGSRVRDNHHAGEIRLTAEDQAALDAAFPPPRRKQPLEMI